MRHAPPGHVHTADVVLGIDVGSTTVKVTVVDTGTRAIIWSDYQRHETRQAEKLAELLEAAGHACPELNREGTRAFITGSGAGPLREALGAKFIQEVNAVTIAVEHLHPEVGSVIELGGQDAKIVIFAETSSGGRRAIASMNDKCASGTGATIDKCLIKVGMPRGALATLAWDPTRLHHVAAKCGVFAETDIVNLVKAGIPADEIMCSLADAIVSQNLSVLTRGNTLRPRVLLLGGPNTFLPFLQACWRQRIAESWSLRGTALPADASLDELVFAPGNAQYYAAFGAALYGLMEPAGVGRYRGLEPLRAFMAHGRRARLGSSAGPGLARSQNDLQAFTTAYSIPRFTPAALEAGTVVRGVIGIDGGSTSSKAVLLDEQGSVLSTHYQLSQGNPLADAKQLLAAIQAYVHTQGATLDLLGLGVTGYAADVLRETLHADATVVETVAHAAAATKYFGSVDVICDIGGQDIKVLFMANGEIRNFRLSNQCSAGNGMLLQAMADQFGVPVSAYADTAFAATLSPTFSYGCAVFLDADRVNFQKEGYSKEELLAGLAMVLPKNVWQYVVQIPRMAALGRTFVLQGGTQYNLAALKAQVDYIRERVPDAVVHVHPHPGEAGAIGAALEARHAVGRRGHSTFVGLQAAIDLSYTTRNDEDTRCDFCPNNCARTFIDARTPDGATSRFIAGFSCEKGTVESTAALKALTARRRELRVTYPNLVDYESRLLFRSVYRPEPLPEATTLVDRIEVTSTVFGGVRRTSRHRPFQRSSDAAAERRRNLQVGIPRVLNIYSTAPIWRAYFETLGLRSENVVFSDQTSEELWAEGGKYGSIDPCYPSKVAQAHIHNLLFGKPRHRFDYVFFPCITHVPSFVANTMDTASCPIVAGAPKVTRAAFTKDVDFFGMRGIDYVDGAVTLVEPNYFKRQMFEMWGERLGITEDESDWACDEGFAALATVDEDLQRRGLAVLQQLEHDNKVGVLLLGRPYHSDPGLNHGVLDEFQAMGYPVLSIRSLPKDPGYLARFFRDDLERGFIQSPLDISDVWPENFSANSAQKVWAAKFAARHPNLVVLDLSSFKCGHDAPIYGLVDSIVSSSQTPFSALHDIDANKPSGSIAIRVKTYAHTLARHEERLQDLAARRTELQVRIDARRHELMREHQAKWMERIRRQAAPTRRLDDLDRAYDAYLTEDAVLPAFTSPDRSLDIAPLPSDAGVSPVVAASTPRAASPPHVYWLQETQ